VKTTYLFEEMIVEPNEKYDGAQNLDSDKLGVEKKAVEVERLLAARRPEIEGGLRHNNPLFPRRIEDSQLTPPIFLRPCRAGYPAPYFSLFPDG